MNEIVILQENPWNIHIYLGLYLSLEADFGPFNMVFTLSRQSEKQMKRTQKSENDQNMTKHLAKMGKNVTQPLGIFFQWATFITVYIALKIT